MVVTNPPYSGDHFARLLDFLRRCASTRLPPDSQRRTSRQRGERGGMEIVVGLGVGLGGSRDAHVASGV